MNESAPTPRVITFSTRPAHPPPFNADHAISQGVADGSIIKTATPTGYTYTPAALPRRFTPAGRVPRSVPLKPITRMDSSDSSLDLSQESPQEDTSQPQRLFTTVDFRLNKEERSASLRPTSHGASKSDAGETTLTMDGDQGRGMTGIDDQAEEGFESDIREDMALLIINEEDLGSMEDMEVIEDTDDVEVMGGTRRNAGPSTAAYTGAKRGRKPKPPAGIAMPPPAPAIPLGRTRSGIIPFAPPMVAPTEAQQRALASKQAKAKKNKERRSASKQAAVGQDAGPSKTPGIFKLSRRYNPDTYLPEGRIKGRGKTSLKVLMAAAEKKNPMRNK